MAEPVLYDLELLYKKLTGDFPNEAYKPDTSRGFERTTLTAQWAVERMNETFGPLGFGWIVTPTYSPTMAASGAAYVLCRIALQYRICSPGGAIGYHPARLNPETDIFEAEPGGDFSYPVMSAGGHGVMKDRLDDAWKSALTDAMTKGVSRLGVGNDLFRGLITSVGETRTRDKAQEPLNLMEIYTTAKQGDANVDTLLGAAAGVMGYNIAEAAVRRNLTKAVLGDVPRGRLSDGNKRLITAYLENQFGKAGFELLIAKALGKMAAKRILEGGDTREFKAVCDEIQGELDRDGKVWVKFNSRAILANNEKEAEDLLGD